MVRESERDRVMACNSEEEREGIRDRVMARNSEKEREEV